MTLHAQVALITGASRGLGLAISHRLQQAGAHLVLAARELAPLQEAATGLRLAAGSGQQVIFQPADVSHEADVADLVKRAVDAFGRVDILVCNAGVYGPFGLIESVDWDDWVSAIQINLMGTVLCCRAVVPIMRQQGKGKIIILSGGGATQPLPRMSAYAASKAAVVRFTETLAEEVSDTGIDVNAIAPGMLNTRLLDSVLSAGPENVGADFYARSLALKAQGGVPLETGAELVAFLASSESDGITGRLLSAVWDDWRNLPAQRERLSKSDVYTLRRIIPSDRDWDERVSR